MAHVGEKFALGAIGRFGVFFRLQQLPVSLFEFRRPFLHPLFQVVASFLQRAVLRLNLVQHFIEPVNEMPQFIFALFHRADGIVFLTGDDIDDSGEMRDRARDKFLQISREH